MIPIQNIYYMLAYAFRVLQKREYKKMATEPFHNTAELCAAILTIGIATQCKKGLYQTYQEQTELLSVFRGKIDINASLQAKSMWKKEMVCQYDTFSSNIYHNRILKSTILLLLKADITNARKKALRKYLIFFQNVDNIDIKQIDWHIPYHRNNQTYRMLLSICYLVVKGLLQSNANGTMTFMDFFDEQQMHRLYEKFVFTYYQQEFPQIKVTASKIPWQVDDGFCKLLPTMQTDIMLSYDKQCLIIDTKYYAHTLQMRFDIKKIHSQNLYQIFTYTKNKTTPEQEVSGMILYAKTDEQMQPNHVYHMSGTKISVKTLDLCCHFSEIAKQCNQIVYDHFGEI